MDVSEVGGPAGTPIFENEEEEDYVQLIYSVAEKNGGIRKTTKGHTHTHTPARMCSKPC